MATVVIASDLHLGLTGVATLWQLHDRIAAASPHLTVLAGDLGEPLERFVACLEIFRDLPGTVAVLAGNHDIWASGRYQSRELFERYLPEATRQAGMLWLEDAVWQHEHLAVAGSLAWYDYSAAAPDLPPDPGRDFALIKRIINHDARWIDWPWQDPEVAGRLGAGLLTRLRALEADPATGSVLIVTHVPLCEEQLLRVPGDEQDGLKAAFYGNLSLGRQVQLCPKVRVIVSGHTHVGRHALLHRSKMSDVATAVVPSDYGAPGYLVVETETWRIREGE